MTPDYSVKPPIHPAFTRFDACKFFPIRRWLRWETAFRLDSFEKNFQAGNTKKLLFFQELLLSPNFYSLYCKLCEVQRQGRPPQSCLLAPVSARTQFDSTQRSEVLQPACPIPLKSMYATDSAYNDHLFIAFSSVGPEFICFRPSLNMPWKSLSCRPPKTYVTLMDWEGLLINSKKEMEWRPTGVNKELDSKKK